jgi:hypothetical protein
VFTQTTVSEGHWALACRPNATSSRQFIGRIAAERNEVGYLFRIHAISLTDIFGLHAQFRRPVTDRELSRVPMQAERNPDRRSAQTRNRQRVLSHNRGGEKVIRLESRSFGLCNSAGGHKVRQYVRLFNPFVIELSPALIGGKHLVALRRRFQSIPADNDRRGAARPCTDSAIEHIERQSIRASRDFDRFAAAVSRGIQIRWASRISRIINSGSPAR